MITNRDAGTSLDEIADGIFRIRTPVTAGGLRFNQYLVADEAPCCSIPGCCVAWRGDGAALLCAFGRHFAGID